VLVQLFMKFTAVTDTDHWCPIF